MRIAHFVRPLLNGPLSSRGGHHEHPATTLLRARMRCKCGACHRPTTIEVSVRRRGAGFFVPRLNRDFITIGCSRISNSGSFPRASKFHSVSGIKNRAGVEFRKQGFKHFV